MPTHLTSKGQVTVPKAVRDYLGLRAGTAVEFERLPSGDVVLRPAGKRTKTVHSQFARFRGRATVRLSTEAILSMTRGSPIRRSPVRGR